MITVTVTKTAVNVDDAATLADMRKACPAFFRPFAPFGPASRVRGETHDVHRGFLIVRHTRPGFLTGVSRRVAVVYAFTRNLNGGGPDLFHVESLDNPDLREAKRFVDSIIQEAG